MLRAAGTLQAPGRAWARQFIRGMAKGAKKKEKAKGPEATHVDKGYKYGHGGEDRPRPPTVRAEGFKSRMAAFQGRDVDAAGNLVTDDERLQPLYDLVNAGGIEAEAAKRGIDLSAPSSSFPATAADEELWQMRDAASHATYARAFKIPDEVAANARLVDDDMDVAAATDAELSEEPFDERIDTEATIAAWGKRGRMGLSGASRRPEDRPGALPGRAVAAARAAAGRGAAAAPAGVGASDSDTAPGDDATLLGLLEAEEGSAAASKKGPKASGARPPSMSGAGGAGSDTDAFFASLDSEGEAGSSGADGWSEGEGAAVYALGTAPGASLEGVPRVQVPSPAALARRGLRYDSSDGDLVMDSPLRAPRRRGAAGVVLPGASSQAAEDDALHEEQARALLRGSGGGSGGAAATPSSAAVEGFAGGMRLSDDDSSDWGGDAADARFDVHRFLQLREYQSRYGLGDLEDADSQALLHRGFDPTTGTRLGGIFGDAIEAVPSSIVEELATPYDFYDHAETEPYPTATTAREAAMTPEERVMDEERKKLRDVIERPLPIVNRPLMPTYGMICAADTVRLVTAGGMIDSARVCVVMGNGMGGVGYGIGKHREAFKATKMAVAAAQRDMIHVSTHKGQLYHDLIGKKNSIHVIIRTMPSSSAVNNVPVLIGDIFELAGITHASAKVVGSKRRNPYNVVQAVFDAFNHHYPPEDEAAMRGLRMQWMGADRHNPRNVYPFAPSGPRFLPANRRHMTGNLR